MPATLQIVSVTDLPEPSSPHWRRWLTPPELHYCAGFKRAGEHLAVRVAGKQAVIVAAGLLPTDDDGWWHQVELLRGQHEPPRVVLSGALRERQLALGLQLSASFTHAGGRAAAMAWLRSA